MHSNLTQVDFTTGVREWLAQLGGVAPTVVVPIYNAYEDVCECVESLLLHTPVTSPILLIDDCSTDTRILELGQKLAAEQVERVFYLRKQENSGFVGSVNLGFDISFPRDVVIVNSDLVLPARWLERLQMAAYTRTNVATVTPFTNHGTMLSLPRRNRPSNDLPPDLTLAEIDERIECASSKLYPPIPTAIGHCTYFRRSALDVVGYFDEAFSPGYGEEVDFSQRAIIHGFVNLAADNVFVYHKGSRSFNEKGRLRREQIQIEHEQLLQSRYPWYTSWMHAESNAMHNPLATALGRARRALQPVRIAIDATYVAPTTTGTSVVAFELIRALGTSPQRSAELFVIVRNGTTASFSQRIGDYVDGIYSVDRLLQMDAPMFDLVFRPAQLRTIDDLRLLHTVAEKLIVFQLDFIAYANPAYVASKEEWMEYRRITELVLATADGVGYLSNDVMADGSLHGLEVPEERCCVLNSGVDHYFHRSQTTPRSPANHLSSKSFLLVLGTNFLHKNRAHNLRIFEELLKQTNWSGTLVFAGPRVSHGGSIQEEGTLFEQLPLDVRSRIVDLGEVDEDEKNWLLEHAAVVLYPSICEGFGLIPFEAATYGTPTIPARSTSLQEILGEGLIYFDTFDPSANAGIVYKILTDEKLAQRQVDIVLERSQHYQWDSVATSVWDFVFRTLSLPHRAHLIREKLVLSPPQILATGAAALLVPRSSVLSFPERWNKRFRKLWEAVQAGNLRTIEFEVKQYLRWKFGP
jgi:GT2 family glycosyltransferase